MRKECPQKETEYIKDRKEHLLAYKLSGGGVMWKVINLVSRNFKNKNKQNPSLPDITNYDQEKHLTLNFFVFYKALRSEGERIMISGQLEWPIKPFCQAQMLHVLGAQARL